MLLHNYLVLQIIKGGILQYMKIYYGKELERIKSKIKNLEVNILFIFTFWIFFVSIANLVSRWMVEVVVA